MTQSTPNLFTVILGSGGLIGGLIALGGAYTKFLNKRYVEPLERTNSTLSSENSRLHTALEKAKAERDEAFAEVDKLVSLLESFRESEVSPDNAAKLRRIMVRIRRVQSMQVEEAAYKAAAHWLNYRKSDWAKEALKIAVQEHPTLLPTKIRKHFQQDITNYLEWAYKSLHEYQHANAPLNEFVQQPIIRSPFPYIAAIRYIRDNGDRVELNMEQSTHLETMLNKLIEKIPDEFKDS